MSTEKKRKTRSKGQFLDRTDQEYGRLVVLHEELPRQKAGIRWWCRCACGNKLVIPSTSLKYREHCGCERKGKDQKGRRLPIKIHASLEQVLSGRH